MGETKCAIYIVLILALTVLCPVPTLDSIDLNRSENTSLASSIGNKYSIFIAAIVFGECVCVCVTFMLADHTNTQLTTSKACYALLHTTIVCDKQRALQIYSILDNNLNQST